MEALLTAKVLSALIWGHNLLDVAQTVEGLWSPLVKLAESNRRDLRSLGLIASEAKKLLKLTAREKIPGVLMLGRGDWLNKCWICVLFKLLKDSINAAYESKARVKAAEGLVNII